MKIFVDANVLVTLLNREYPDFPQVAKLFSLPSSKFKFYATTLSLGISFYFAEKKHGAALAKQKITTLLEHIAIADCGMKEARAAAIDKKVNDFEDGMQYYAALHEGCQYILTNNQKDYYYSKIKVVSTKDFLINETK